MKLSTATRATPKPRKAKPAKVTTPKATEARRIVERMISAYMSYVKDNPGGTP